MSALDNYRNTVIKKREELAKLTRKAEKGDAQAQTARQQDQTGLDGLREYFFPHSEKSDY